MGKGTPHTAQRAAIVGIQMTPSRRARSHFSDHGRRRKQLRGELLMNDYCCASHALTTAPPPQPPTPRRSRSVPRSPPPPRTACPRALCRRLRAQPGGGRQRERRRQHPGQRQSDGSAGQRGSGPRAGSRPGTSDRGPTLEGLGKTPVGVSAPGTAASACWSEPRAQCRFPQGARKQRKSHLGPLNFPEPNACRS